MIVEYFLKGFLIGLAMTISIGPLTIMCIRETLAEGQLRGLAVGLGASTGDLFYSSVAAFGITIISDFLIAERFWIHLVGGIILFVMGFRMFRAEPPDPNNRLRNGGVLKLYISAAIIALTNPITIFAFLALFATVGLASEYNSLHALAIVTGVFTGSYIWFVVLTFGIKFFRSKFDMRRMRLANKIAGILVFIAGIYAIVSLFFR
ncbi:MAG: LysE family translocator [Ignavibacteria bacterium]|jgi:threonine/homoserine/homoserine lactone efflux protein|nr:LysE family translocator [Ignavibacteria bacterium]MCU7502073.1 LysE family translocator [Ignavibacteria bacterium]MCU7515475.1 LysE family translocator [Ignavibacteria bacterium]